MTSIGGTSARTTASRFAYIALRPSVPGVSSSDGSAGGGTSVTVSGTNLTGGTGPVDGGTAVTIAGADLAGAIGVDITVTTDGGPSAASPADAFTYEAGP